ncbi:hypothetical protein D6856_04545 [Butyrivibrio sp. XB500-5]|uniref:hypothetical protein n=1 Tax=Butyrivibrio sp. XB500-5 TaxID=2364880 RepID=UPI000EA9DB27|nr:hypothetical protein [Butyrivibrio sp. XB500-5]RKM63398.1 hypothetical protein D6856_04545 [Butyrivibrio sp. XB500-5]
MKKKLLDKYLFWIVLGLFIIAAFIIRLKLAPNTELSPDYDSYYREWVEFYRANGIVKGLENAPGDYYVPFNVIYALCSLLPVEPWVPLSMIPFVCELVSAFFICKIFFLLTGKKETSLFIGGVTLFLPFVVFNGALWKQVDAVYTCFLIISLYELLRQKYRAAFIWYAVSFAFKLQSIIFLPVLVILYLTDGFLSETNEASSEKKKLSIINFFWIPVVYLIAGLPEVLAGHGLKATYFAYLGQTGELQSEGYGMVSYFPNIYNWGLDPYDEILTVPAVLTLLVVLAVLALFCYRKKESLDRNTVLYLAIFLAWTCLMLLPGMHERYDYAMLLLLTPFAVMIRKKLIVPMVVANLCSLATYSITLFHTDIFDMKVVSIFYVAAYIYTAIDFVRVINGGISKVEA